MRGASLKRKRLHEHEAVLFAFIVLFIAGGIAFWGYDTFAVEYYVGSSPEVYAKPLTINTLVGKEKIVDITVKNIKKDPNVDVAVAIIEIDPKCTVVGQNVEGGCESLKTQIIGDSTVYPGGETKIRINFTSDKLIEIMLVLNIVTSEAIDQVVISFNTVQEFTEGVQDVTTLRDTTIIDRLISALRIAASGLTQDQISETKKAPIVRVDQATGIGVTASSINFGTLNSAIGEQSTKKLEVENLGPSAVDILGFTKPRGIIITPFSPYNLKSGERKSYDITCSPTSATDITHAEITINTNRGNIPIAIICLGGNGRSGEKDVLGPTVKLLEPTQGDVATTFNVKVEAYDENVIQDVAMLKVYLGSSLIKRFVEPAREGLHVYEFVFDSSRYTGIKDLYVEATDYSGNKGVSNRATLWLKGPKKEEVAVVPVVEEKKVEVKKQTPSAEALKIFVKKKNAKIYSELNEAHVAAGGQGDIRMTYDLKDIGEFSFEFKGAEIQDAENALLADEDVRIREVGNGNKIIDIADTRLREIVQTLSPETVVMPMLKPAGYTSPSDLNLVYYRSDGTSFEIQDDDVISITDDGDILKIEIRSEVILGTA